MSDVNASGYQDELPTLNEAKLKAAMVTLGDSWLHHPEYDPQKHPQHGRGKQSIVDFNRIRAGSSTYPKNGV